MRRNELVSCLMVTKDPTRFELLRKSVRCYLEQDYNPRELVICCDGPRSYKQHLQRYVQSLERADIRVVCFAGERSLGEMRNISVGYIRGDFVCQWDDDDLNHPERLGTQLARMKEAGCPVSFFQDQLHFFYSTHELYWVNWAPDLIPGTLLCRKEILERFPYPLQARGEDGQLRNTLRQNVNVAALGNHGHLSVYTFHGQNTWDLDHHQHIHVNHDATYLRGREATVRAALRYFDIPPPKLMPE